MSSQTTLVLKNATDQEVQVWLTLGDVDGCIRNVKQIPFVTNIGTCKDEKAQICLQGWFTLAGNDSVSYTPPEGVGLSGNFSFGHAPQACPPPEGFPDGLNLAEFTLNVSPQVPEAQETIEISAVDGLNAFIKFSMTGGGVWNAGPTQPNVTEFFNKGLHGNSGQVGVYPYGCDKCTESVAPAPCPGVTRPPHDECQKEAICNVQRPASEAGGTVLVTFNGFTKPWVAPE